LKKEYIGIYISGVTPRGFFSQIEGMFYLNLKHPKYILNSKSALSILLISKVADSIVIFDDFIIARDLYNFARHLSLEIEKGKKDKRIDKFSIDFKLHALIGDKKPINSLDNMQDILLLFPFEKNNRKSINLMQAKVYNYASILLTRYFNALDNDEEVYKKGIVKTINSDFFEGVLLKSKENDSIDDGLLFAKTEFCKIIYKMSLFLARRIKKHIKIIKKEPLYAMDYIIFPLVDNTLGLFIAIESFYKKNGVTRFNKFIQINADYLNHNQTIIIENTTLNTKEEYTKEKYKYGFLTKVAKKTYS